MNVVKLFYVCINCGAREHFVQSGAGAGARVPPLFALRGESSAAARGRLAGQRRGLPGRRESHLGHGRGPARGGGRRTRGGRRLRLLEHHRGRSPRRDRVSLRGQRDDGHSSRPGSGSPPHVSTVLTFFTPTIKSAQAPITFVYMKLTFP